MGLRITTWNGKCSQELNPHSNVTSDEVVMQSMVFGKENPSMHEPQEEVGKHRRGKDLERAAGGCARWELISDD